MLELKSCRSHYIKVFVIDIVSLGNITVAWGVGCAIQVVLGVEDMVCAGEV